MRVGSRHVAEGEAAVADARLRHRAIPHQADLGRDVLVRKVLKEVDVRRQEDLERAVPQYVIVTLVIDELRVIHVPQKVLHVGALKTRRTRRTSCCTARC